MLKKFMIFLRRQQVVTALPFQKPISLMTNTAKKCPCCKKRGLILHEQNFVHEIYECKFCGQIVQAYSFWLRITIAAPILLIFFIAIIIVMLF
jgi:hypothetical protein